MKKIFVLIMCFSLCLSLTSCNTESGFDTSHQSNVTSIEAKNDTNEMKATEVTETQNDTQSLYNLTETNFSTGRKTKRVTPQVKDGKLQIPLEGISYVRCFREVFRVPETGINTFYRNQDTIAKMINYFNSLDITDEPSDAVYSLMTGIGSINAIIFYENDDVILITFAGSCIAFDHGYLDSERTWYMVDGDQYRHFGKNILGIDV